MLGEVLVIHQAVVSDEGEDSFAVSNSPDRLMLCVADGCGGLGSRRYNGGRTGAYLASRLATGALTEWERPKPRIPVDAEHARFCLHGLQVAIDTTFRCYAQSMCQDETPSRIVGSMQRMLPTTLCMVQADIRTGQGVFIWAGDSRGYTLDGSGLHQYTQDDVRGDPDAFESLLKDRPLSNYICADKETALHARGFALPEKGLLLCATDGVYGIVSSPMELEMLLLDTLQRAWDQGSWQRALEKQLAPLLQDDTTLLCCPRGFGSFRELQRYFRPRWEELKREYIKPITARQHDRETVRALWQRYRIGYDRTEGMAHEQPDWRV